MLLCPQKSFFPHCCSQQRFSRLPMTLDVLFVQSPTHCSFRPHQITSLRFIWYLEYAHFPVLCAEIHNYLSTCGEVFLFTLHFPVRITANSSPFSNFFLIWDVEACDMHIFLAISLRDISVFWSNAEMADFFLGVRSFVFPLVKKCSKCSSSAEMKKKKKT